MDNLLLHFDVAFELWPFIVVVLGFIGCCQEVLVIYYMDEGIGFRKLHPFLGI